MTNYEFDFDDFQEYRKENIGFTKYLIWYYEKETRLLLKLSKEYANTLEDDKEYIVTMSIPDKAYKKIYVDFAPEIDDITSAIQGYEGIANFIYETSNGNYSQYRNMIKMNLASRCDYESCKKINNISNNKKMKEEEL